MQQKERETIIVCNLIGWVSGLSLSALIFIGCQEEETEPTTTTVAAATTGAATTTWGTGTTTGWATTASVDTPDPDLDTPSAESTSEGGETLDSSQNSASEDPIGCTDEAAAHFAGCQWAAELKHQPDCTHCTEDPCTQIACSDACQRPLVQALDRCNATYPNCAQLLADPHAECLERCRRSHTLCIYEIICEMPTGPDTSPCDPPDAECVAQCDRFRSSTE